MKALIIEDEQGFLELMVDAFKAEGFEVQGTDNGKSAIQLAEENRFDIIICDLNLPDIHGIELLACLKGVINCLNSSFFVVSGVVDSEAEQRIENMGIVQIFSKPVRIDALLEKVKEVAEERERKLDPKTFAETVKKTLQSEIELEVQNALGEQPILETSSQVPSIDFKGSFYAGCAFFGIDFWGGISFYGDENLLLALTPETSDAGQSYAIKQFLESIAKGFCLSSRDELNGDGIETILWRKRNYVELGSINVELHCKEIKDHSFVPNAPEYYAFKTKKGIGLIELDIQFASKR